MRYKVTADFSTPLRRFHVGDDIAAEDIDGVLSAEDWAGLGKLEAMDRRLVPRNAPAVTAGKPVVEDHQGEAAPEARPAI